MGAEYTFAKFLLGMFGFFSVGMFVSQSYMYGPDSPLGFPMIYWTTASDHPITEWWSRIVGVLFLSFLSGPFAFGADIWVHLKQTMVAMTGLLVCIVYINVLYPELCAVMWKPQIVLQIGIVAYNAKLLTVAHAKTV